MKTAVFANGPGEVWGWCRPVIDECARRGWEADIHLLPCPYASGHELDALNGFPARVFLHKTVKDALFRPSQIRDYDAVLQLGGDLLFGRTLAYRRKLPLACYSYGYKQGMKSCDVVMTSRSGLFEAPNLEIVGDLVLDGLDGNGEMTEWKAPEKKRLVLFPGSRPAIRQQSFGMLCAFRKRMLQLDPGVEMRVMMSPFTSEDEFHLWSDEGFPVYSGPAASGVKGATLAFTQPGTNTLELMYCGLPHVVAIPYDFLRVMPLSGLTGLIGNIPVLGAKLREAIIRSRMPRYAGRTAWCNRMSGRSIVPELIGEYSYSDLACEVLKIMQDTAGLEKMKKELGGLASEVEPGSPVRICDILERMTAGWKC